MSKKQCMSESERALLKKYVHFMAGFEECSIYDDYKEADPHISDEEFSKAFDLIRTLSREGMVC